MMIRKKNIYFSSIACAVMLAIACNKKSGGIDREPEPPAPPPVTSDTAHYPPYSWQEHWFDHRQVVKRVHFNDDIAVYYDDDVNRTKSTWLYGYVDSIWKYTKEKYGQFGTKDTTNRLFAIFHTNKYGGGHPGTYLAPRHDYRNVIDIGSGANAWENKTSWELNIVLHEVSHIVELGSKGVRDSPAFGIWGDSKWAEIYVYDLYIHLGRDADKERVYNAWMAGTDNFPRANTAWFRNWFFPIYDKYGKVEVLNKYFELLAGHFPQGYNNGIKTYSRSMNMGEFVHFWSAAAGVDLSYRAYMTFGPRDRNNNEWLPQLEAAKSTFTGLTYTADNTYGEDLSVGAVIEVSNENANGANGAEGSLKLIDKDNNSKFFLRGYTTDFAAVQTLESAQAANAYLLTSGNDAVSRDPKNWVLEGSDDKSTWTTLDTKTNYAFMYRNDIRIIDIPNAIPYKYYRLRITANAGSTDLQFSEWRLLKRS